MIFDNDLRMLFAVNAGDNTVTAFTTLTRDAVLKSVAHVPSGGTLPVSVAVSQNRLYVLNVGGTGTVATFEIAGNGELLLLDTLELGLDNPTCIPFDQAMAPGQIGVDALGRRLIITHGAGQELLSAPLDDDGIPTDSLITTTTPGVVPFAFDVSRNGNILLAEAGTSSVSSFSPSAVGQPFIVTSESIATGQTATCWIVATDRYAYVANTGANNISSFTHSRTGAVTLLEANAASTSNAPIDMTLAGNNRYLYTLDAGSGSIFSFSIDADTGQLHALEAREGLPASAGLQGIAAFDF
ncbi:MAG: beta-propeller fold lactonase family protein [Gammaproteobacteria bacterium]